MPKAFDWNGFRFHFFSNEGDPREPPHIHVTKDRDTAKFGCGPMSWWPTAAGFRRGCYPILPVL